MGAVVSKKKIVKKVSKSNTSISFESTQATTNNNNNNVLQQYIEDEQGTFLPVNANHVKSNQVNTPSSSAIQSKPQERQSSYMDQYYQDDESNQMNHTTSFVLPENWETKEYQYQLHFALKSLFNGNVAHSALPRLKKGARIIHMGTWTGPWIMDMATQYPDCSFIGINLTSSGQDTTPPLPNVKFETGNVFETGLVNLEDESVDYIHMRTIGTLISTSQWPLIFNEINRILKPEGIIRIEELEHSPSGTVMIESFIETIKTLLSEMGQDVNIALKYGTMLRENGFEVIDRQVKKVHYASDGKLSNEFVSAILNMFLARAHTIVPKLGLDMEDYRHRIETICTECVRKNAYMEWYSWVAKKPLSN